MGVPAIVWLATAGILLALIARDLVDARRTRPAPPPGSDARTVGGYLLLAALFGLAVLEAAGAQPAGKFFAGWGGSLAVTVDSLMLLLLITGGIPDAGRIVALNVAVAVPARAVLVAFYIPTLPVLTWITALFGVAVLVSAWAAFRHDDPATLPKPLDRPGLAQAAAVSVAVGFALVSVSTTEAVTGETYLMFCANLFALLGLHRLFRLISTLVALVPDASVGLAVVLVFIGAKVTLTAATGNSHDWRVTGLTLGMIVAVSILSAITVVRTPHSFN